MWGKGGHFPYRDYIGKIINLSEGTITFERLDDVVKYLHYGDNLVIFSFSEAKDELPTKGYFDNSLNQKCFDTKCIYVKNVLSFEDASTVDYIYENVCDRSNFINCVNVATSHLRDRELFEAAQRWEELSYNENNSSKEVSEETKKKKKFWNYVIDWIRMMRS